MISGRIRPHPGQVPDRLEGWEENEQAAGVGMLAGRGGGCGRVS